MEIHERASTFLSEKLMDTTLQIAISIYQIAEIMDILRKGNLQKNVRKDIFKSFNTTRFHIVNIGLKTLELCFKKSLVSGIHIYDYLVAIPLKGMVNEIFSADDHFQHKDFKQIAKVSNPLFPWILREGKAPIYSKEQP